jgi:hypothetical protein
MDDEIYAMALIGYREERDRLDRSIAGIEAQLGGRKPSAAPAPGRRGAMSEAGRQRIAAAQRKRWAALKKGKPAASAAPKKKRVLSAEGRKRIIEATRKRWAAYRKAAAANQ